MVKRLVQRTSADTIALSCLRRALVVDDYTLVLARSSPPEPIVRPAASGQTDALNPMAPIHRWVDSVNQVCSRFLTFDVWLSERLAGRSVCAESQAWLTGLWDTSLGAWEESTCADALIRPEDLPEVLSEVSVVAGVCLPVIGDHEATALACAAANEWPLSVAECGTALACMIGGGPQVPPRLGLAPPFLCGYTELVDPHFERRINGNSAPAPSWMTNAGSPSASDVVVEAFMRQEKIDRPVLLCGGNVTRALVEDLSASGLDVVVRDTIASSVGALILAERATGAMKEH